LQRLPESKRNDERRNGAAMKTRVGHDQPLSQSPPKSNTPSL
jgi:hypothetical protein